MSYKKTDKVNKKNRQSDTRGYLQVAMWHIEA